MPALTITLLEDGLVFEGRAGQSLLAAAEKARCAAIPYGCRSGGCGLCKVRIVSGGFLAGRMSSRHVGPQEAAAGFVLA